MNKKIAATFNFSIVVFLGCMQTGFAQHHIANLTIEIILESPLYMYSEYTSVFRIENLDYYSGYNKSLNAELHYNVSRLINATNSTLYVSNTSSISLRKYTYAETAFVFFNESGLYELCGRIMQASEEGINLSANNSNSWACKNLSVLNPANVSCNVSLNLSTDKFFYYEGEKIKIINELSNDTFPFEIAYWIEDIFGEIIKKPWITENTNKKAYTVHTHKNLDIWYVKNSLQKVSCNNAYDNQTNRQMIVVLNNQTMTEDADQASDESSIIIEKIEPQDVAFGETLKVHLIIHKGDTRKYSLTIKPGGGSVFETLKIHMPQKHSTLKAVVPIVIDSNFNLKHTEGEYQILIDGLGVHAEASFEINGFKNEVCTCKLTDAQNEQEKRPSGTIVGFEKINNIHCANQQVDYSFFIENNRARPIEFTFYGYIYRGSKCYSGIREQNKIAVVLDEYEKKVINLSNNFTGETGAYKLKVRIYEENRKTPHELTLDVNITNCTKVLQRHFNNGPQINITSFLGVMDRHKVKEEIVRIPFKEVLIYESSSEKSRKSIPLLAFIVLALLFFIIIWKRDLTG